MRILLLPFVLFNCAASAQLINGSFENDLGMFSDSGWVSTCSVMAGPGAPGCGNTSILVPHSNSEGCGWSRLDQLVPFIQDGETWTLSGWCANFTWFFADPYSGFRFGIKDDQGNLSFNTAALQNTGNWTFLSVTNSFDLGPGDTVFVECDPGTVSGLGNNAVFAMFDGVELNSLSTGTPTAPARPELHLFPDPAEDVLHYATDRPVLETRILTSNGQLIRSHTEHGSVGTRSIPLVDLSPGPYLLWVRTADDVRIARFEKR